MMSKVLLDTNVLLRLANPDDPGHGQAILAVDSLNRRDATIAIVPQCLHEYYVVATRPVARNGFGMTSQVARQDMQEFLEKFTLFDGESGQLELWLDLLNKYNVVGKPAHDARLVAALLAFRLDALLTFNVQDFVRYQPDIQVLDARLPV